MRPRTKATLALAALAAAVFARQADTAAEERVIHELDRKWVQAVAAKDTMARRATGRAAIRSAWAQLFKADGAAG